MICKRDDRNQPTVQVELDEGSFSIELADLEKDKPLKRGHGSQKKDKVLIMVESSPSYIKFDEHGHSHQAVTAGKKTIKTFPTWVHIAISNAKRLLLGLGVHHRLKLNIYNTTCMSSATSLTDDISGKTCSTGLFWLLLAITLTSRAEPL